jgi:hypothetical protein
MGSMTQVGMPRCSCRKYTTPRLGFAGSARTRTDKVDPARQAQNTVCPSSTSLTVTRFDLDNREAIAVHLCHRPTSLTTFSAICLHR